MNFIDRIFHRENSARHFNHNLFLDVSQKWNSLHCRDLLAHYGAVDAIEFSDDGMFFVSGGQDRRVLLWNISEVFSNKKIPEPIVMAMEHENSLFCLAVSPDNDRIFSGGKERNVYVHDPIT
jgi:WD repeat-containing protein 22